MTLPRGSGGVPRKHFGTDGVRGLANVELTPELALALGRAAVRVLGADRPFVLARDTRRSGPMLEAALAAGLAAEGADVVLAGVLPTPAAAYLSQSRDCPAAVLSASHNPFPDNGIKFFARGGRKLTDETEARFEAELDAGLAFDGDADRLVAVDERGGLVDGDHILAVAALDLRARGRLRHDTVVATVMANLGFHQAMAAEGIRVETTPVGDRSVLEAMEAGGFSLGGEQSGHIIFGDLATTGDGLLSGLVLLDVMARSGRPLSELAGVVTKLPQVLCNVRVADRTGLDAARPFWDEVAVVEAEMAGGGRVLVRPSGTEPFVRIMVEAATAEAAEAYTERLAATLTAALGLDPAS